MGKEFRRKAPRRDFDGHMGLLYKGEMVFTTCMQVGEGGALVHGASGTKSIAKGDRFVVTVFFPDIGGISATARCLYKTDSGNFGVSFAELDMMFKKRVREYVSRRKL